MNVNGLAGTSSLKSVVIRMNKRYAMDARSMRVVDWIRSIGKYYCPGSLDTSALNRQIMKTQVDPEQERLHMGNAENLTGMRPR